MKPVRVQLKRTAGWRMPENTVKVDRTTKWGNPYTAKGAREAGYQGSDRDISLMVVAEFRAWQRGVVEYQIIGRWPPSTPAIQEHLRGKNLACWCKPGEPCHADVLLDLANRESTAEGFTPGDPSSGSTAAPSTGVLHPDV